MEIPVLDEFLKKVIEVSAEKSEEKGKSVEEFVFEFYKTIADNYTDGIPEEVYNVFISNLPTFKQYVENIMNNLELQESSIRIQKVGVSSELRDIEKRLKSIEDKIIEVRENEVRTRTTRKKVYDGSRKHSFLYGDMTKYHHRTSTKKEVVPTPNISQIRQILDIMVNEETMKDPEKLNEGLMNLYLMQVQEEEGKKFVLQDMHNMFISKYPPFEKYWKQRNRTIDEKQNLLQEKDIKQQQLTELEEQECKINRQITKLKIQDKRRYYEDRCSHGGGHLC